MMEQREPTPTPRRRRSIMKEEERRKRYSLGTLVASSSCWKTGMVSGVGGVGGGWVRGRERGVEVE